ncbi:unnamed protein product [Oppiella nova]|uniref:Platelet-derived growth factor (PDGF) family profile domain-containing protein n=1 Tax=Oppiella nova TaxID=334625 RepID=A0A7R9M9F6_9ACAR|nr:unnamed protein product [Oppiella nova]CAG2172121.1 unnamed protein product [Oppiella nova]
MIRSKMNIKTNIPEWIRIQMKDIRSASDFIDKYLTAADNTHNESNKNIFLQYLERGDSGNRSAEEMDINEEIPRIASPAACIPEMKIIELQATNSGDELYYPSCVRIPRCSGCCLSQRLQCVPILTSFEDISVIRVKYSTVERRLKFEGFKVFRIERHDMCSCDCIQKAVDCSPKQIYSESECRCLCPNVSRYWDYNDCDCKCKSMPLCSTGFSFNNITCRCESMDNDSNISHTDGSIDLNDGYSRLGAHQYALDKKVDTEIDAQNNKGLNILNAKGINPDFNDDYQQNTGS